jgi:hypothetical protein
MDKLPTSPEIKSSDFSFFAFTNQPEWDTPPGWTKIILERKLIKNYQRQITKSRWPKFLGWRHPRLRSCDIIFHGDAYYINPVIPSYWRRSARAIASSDGGLMQNLQVGVNTVTGSALTQELRNNAAQGKDSLEAANYTMHWLLQQKDYSINIPVYKNAIFGYDPRNHKFRKVATEFWEEYSKEQGSWRDQPLWSYFLFRNQLVPVRFPPRRNGCHCPPMGKAGFRGHGGHIYLSNQSKEVLL